MFWDFQTDITKHWVGSPALLQKIPMGKKKLTNASGLPDRYNLIISKEKRLI